VLEEGSETSLGAVRGEPGFGWAERIFVAKFLEEVRFLFN
jgi:hypothetical protein